MKLWDQIKLAYTAMSLPSWERGLKLGYGRETLQCHTVAPFVGAWIETYKYKIADAAVDVSLPSWERGLKPIGMILV